MAALPAGAQVPDRPDGAERLLVREENWWREEPWWREAPMRDRTEAGALRKRRWEYPKERPAAEMEGSLQPVTPSFNPPNPFRFLQVSYLSNPVFADIDADGDLDALIGDAYGNTIFIENTGTASESAFASPQTNPFGITDVGRESSPAFADIDADGDLDAFIGNSVSETHFFENVGTASAPAFAAPQANAFGLDITPGYGSNPTFADIDGDGDLDAFIGESGFYSLDFGYTFFFENIGTASAPAFAPAETDPFGLQLYAAGRSLELVDIDDDGDLDAFVGDAYGRTHVFENTGTSSAPTFASPQQSPFGLKDVGYWSSPAFADIDADGDLDAFVGSGIGNTSVFENTGSPTSPLFAALPPNPLGITDVGDDSSPDFVDIDADGDLDAFVGNVAGNAVFFLNAGTPTSPAFAAPQTNPFGLTDVDRWSSPTFADIDADGDFDAFIGNYGGATTFFENAGSPTSPAFSIPQTNPLGLDYVAYESNLAFVDIDADSDLDVFIGDLYGYTTLFENVGTPSAPAFASSQKNPFGLEEVRASSSPAFADIDFDGDFDAFIGGARGVTLFQENTGSPTHPAFAPSQPNPFGLASVPYLSHPAFADIDGDGDLDALIGDGYGNTYFFENTSAPEDTTPPECRIARLDPGPPTRLDVLTHDIESGLAAIEVLQDKNATVHVPYFEEGTTDEVLVRATKIDPRRGATIALRVTDLAGNETTCDPVLETVTAEIPERFGLEHNYPNPFNPQTTIRFHLAEPAHVRLEVFDAVGRRVATLADRPMLAGTYAATLEASDLPSGTYVYRLRAGHYSESRTMTLLR